MCATNTVLAQSAIDTKQELTVIYDLQDQAFAARDAETITAYYAADYVAKIKQDTFRYTESAKNLKDFFSTTNKVSLARTTLEKIEPAGDTKIAFILRLIKGSMVFAGGKTREFEIELRAEEYWTKNSAGKWLTRRAIEHSRILKIDGIEENGDVLESSRAAIEAIYNQIDAALKTKNVRAMFFHWTPDFVEINNGKTATSAEIETAFGALFAQITEVSNVHSQISQVKTVNENYLVVMQRTIKGEMISKNKKVSFEYFYQAQETWSKSEQETWKLKISQIINDKFLLNGKEVK